MSLITHFINMILNHFITYNLLLVSAAAHVCMYVCMYVCMWRATSSPEVTNQADKPMYRRLERCAPAALSYINNKLTNIY